MKYTLPIVIAMNTLLVSIVGAYILRDRFVSRESVPSPEAVPVTVYGEARPTTRFQSESGVDYHVEYICYLPPEQQNVGGGAGAETYIVRDGIKYFSRIDGRDLSDLVCQ